MAPAPGPRLMLHADDFGMNSAVNCGIVRGFTHGLLTGTSLLANAPGCDDAIRLWKSLDEDRQRGDLPSAETRCQLADPLAPFDLGVHLNLTQGRPLTGYAFPGELLDDRGNFIGIFGLFRRLNRKRHRYQPALQQELGCQIERLLDSGLSLRHLNGHQYIELIPSVAELIPGLARRYQLPIVRLARETGLWQSTVLPRRRWVAWLLAQVKRHFADQLALRLDRAGILHPQAFYGTAHAGLVTFEVLQQFLSEPLAGETVEIGMHPGTLPSPACCSPLPASQSAWEDPLAGTRVDELDLLQSHLLADWLNSRGVRLSRFSTLMKFTDRLAA